MQEFPEYVPELDDALLPDEQQVAERQAHLARQIAQAEALVQRQQTFAMNRVQQADPEQEARWKAEREAEEARYRAEREREHTAHARGTALSLAAGVCGSSGDPGAVLGAARDFAAFLLGGETEPKAH